MIVYGTSDAKNIKVTNINHHHSTECPCCTGKDGFQIITYSQYFHVWFIPFISIGKKAKVFCTICESRFKPRKLDKTIQNLANQEKSKVRIPLWYFSGIALLAIGVLSLIISLNRSKERNNNYIQNPAVNDIYKVNAEEDSYTLYKVIRVDGDSVDILANNYQATKTTPIATINTPQSYDTSGYYTLARIDLLQMYEEGEIYAVLRD